VREVENGSQRKKKEITCDSLFIHVDQGSATTLSDHMSVDDARHRISILEGELAMLKALIGE